MRVPCPNCGKQVEVAIVDGVAIYYEVARPNPPHECGGKKVIMTSSDRCPYCGEKGDMSHHLCKRDLPGVKRDRDGWETKPPWNARREYGTSSIGPLRWPGGCRSNRLLPSLISWKKLMDNATSMAALFSSAIQSSGSSLQILKGKLLLRPDEVASLLRVSRSTVYFWCQRGSLESHKIGRQIRIPRASVLSYLHKTREI